MPPPEGRSDDGFVLTTRAPAVGRARASSLWPLTFGPACRAVEITAVGAFRASPWKTGRMIIAGAVNRTTAGPVPVRTGAAGRPLRLTPVAATTAYKPAQRAAAVPAEGG